MLFLEDGDMSQVHDTGSLIRMERTYGAVSAPKTVEDDSSLSEENISTTNTTKDMEGGLPVKKGDASSKGLKLDTSGNYWAAQEEDDPDYEYATKEVTLQDLMPKELNLARLGCE